MQLEGEHGIALPTSGRVGVGEGGLFGEARDVGDDMMIFATCVYRTVQTQPKRRKGYRQRQKPFEQTRQSWSEPGPGSKSTTSVARE